MSKPPFLLNTTTNNYRDHNLLAKKVPFVVACFEASAAPRPENLDSDKKDSLFGLGTQVPT
jgi:hypothetical protein